MCVCVYVCVIDEKGKEGREGKRKRKKSAKSHRGRRDQPIKTQPKKISGRSIERVKRSGTHSVRKKQCNCPNPTRDLHMVSDIRCSPIYTPVYPIVEKILFHLLHPELSLGLIDSISLATKTLHSTMENTLTSKPATRPENINAILEGLGRYNVQNLELFHNYVATQCKEGTFDIEANLALLKLYQFNTEIPRDEETVINILVKGVVRFWSSDFMLALHLLPAYVGEVVKSTGSKKEGAKNEEEADRYLDSFAENVNKLLNLFKLLDASKFGEFWTLFESDDSYADLVADVADFETALRKSISQTVEISARRVPVSVLEEWVNLSGNKFQEWVTKTIGWTIEGTSVVIPANKENEAKPVVANEALHFEQLGSLIKRAYEVK